MEKLTEKSNNFAKGILASATTPFKAWTGYFAIWYQLPFGSYLPHNKSRLPQDPKLCCSRHSD
jgi:hypothetical protein